VGLDRSSKSSHLRPFSQPREAPKHGHSRQAVIPPSTDEAAQPIRANILGESQVDRGYSEVGKVARVAHCSASGASPVTWLRWLRQGGAVLICFVAFGARSEDSKAFPVSNDQTRSKISAEHVTEPIKSLVIERVPISKISVNIDGCTSRDERVSSLFGNRQNFVDLVNFASGTEIGMDRLTKVVFPCRKWLGQREVAIRNPSPWSQIEGRALPRIDEVYEGLCGQAIFKMMEFGGFYENICSELTNYGVGGGLCRLSSNLANFDSSPQKYSLYSDSDKLEKGNQNRGNAEPYRVGVQTVLGCAIFGLLFGLGLSVFGWQNFYNRRRLRGAALIGCGWLFGALSLVSIWWWPL
jgi:hypothetical protein